MMSHIYMIFFILFIGFLIGMFTTAVVMQSKGMLKPDVLDEVLIILGEVYDNSMMPPDAYYEARERIIAMKESGHIKTMDLLQEVSIKRGRREALEEVLEIIEREERQADTVGMAEQYQRGYKDACRFVREAVQALKGGE